MFDPFSFPLLVGGSGVGLNNHIHAPQKVQFKSFLNQTKILLLCSGRLLPVVQPMYPLESFQPFNPLDPHNASKHHFASLKNVLISFT